MLTNRSSGQDWLSASEADRREWIEGFCVLANQFSTTLGLCLVGRVGHSVRPEPMIGGLNILFKLEEFHPEGPDSLAWGSVMLSSLLIKHGGDLPMIDLVEGLRRQLRPDNSKN